jgi:hypothetical protein
MTIVETILISMCAVAITVAFLMKLTIRYLDVEVERLREREKLKKPTKPDPKA